VGVRRGGGGVEHGIFPTFELEFAISAFQLFTFHIVDTLDCDVLVLWLLCIVDILLQL
jgi:hypothetical protein